MWIFNPAQISVVLPEAVRIGTLQDCESFRRCRSGGHVRHEDSIGEDKLQPTCLEEPPESSDSWVDALLGDTALENAEDVALARRTLLERRAVFRSQVIPGRCDAVKHQIDTGDAKPIKQGYRGLPYAKREEATRQINKC